MSMRVAVDLVTYRRLASASRAASSEVGSRAATNSLAGSRTGRLTFTSLVREGVEQCGYDLVRALGDLGWAETVLRSNVWSESRPGVFEEVDGVSDVPTWSVQSVIVSVRDLDTSSNFYRDVMNVNELLREDQVAVLGADVTSSFTLILRETLRGTHPGQQSLGIRALTCDVGSSTEIDRVEQRLRALDAFQERQVIDEAEGFEVLHGHDPDRLPLMFLTSRIGRPISLDDYRGALQRIYVVDL
jgi:hypothetical protein